MDLAFSVFNQILGVRAPGSDGDHPKAHTAIPLTMVVNPDPVASGELQPLTAARRRQVGAP
jgi:hypothetical protein